MAELTIKTTVFEGPLDLLLHLIKKLEIDIYDIPIAKITEQYLDYLHSMKILQLDVAGEYLYMAATLMSIKSRLLIPRVDLGTDELANDTFEYEEDPRDSLVEMLIEYKKFKKAATILDEKESERQHFFTREQSDLTHYQEKIPLKRQQIDTRDLLAAFSEAIERKKDQAPLKTTVEADEISVKEKMLWIERKLQGSSTPLSLADLFEVMNRKEIVSTFLALLELMKENTIAVFQVNNYSEIIIESAK
ncbi:segregation and condensation protein A [Lacticigenium naphthae]|uniref:segregation and condensation protein A n=1 Tax=Lacticigenium naphthae TaxID=515351 RepID=UPI0003FE7619|nr:segregation/condensation protein A [Lacticigenium naphthae]